MKTKPLRRSRVQRIFRTLKITDPFARSYPLRQQIPQHVNLVDLPPTHRQHHAGFPPLLGTKVPSQLCGGVSSLYCGYTPRLSSIEKFSFVPVSPTSPI